MCRANKCGRYTQCKSGGDACELLAKPGRLTNHLLAGSACLADPPQFTAVKRPDAVDLTRVRNHDLAGIDEVALVTFHFNPCGFKSLRDTYYRWLPTLGPLASRVQCYELVFDNDTPEIEGSIVLHGTRQANLCWQKEAIINRALRDQPQRVKYFAFIDHDFVMSDPDWLAAAVAKLQSGFVAVQLFDHTYYLDRHNIVERKRNGGMWRWSQNSTLDANPGGAWIADREFLDQIGGVYEYNIAGGGDQTWLDAMRGKIGPHIKEYPAGLQAHCRDYVDRANHIRGTRRATHLNSHAWHIWHGEMKNRQHNSRNGILRNHDFDPARDIRIGDNGILEFTGTKPRIATDLAAFFHGRAEDS